MVAMTPLKEKRLAMALNPNLVREAVNKVDRCMARLQELQYTVTGGTKLISGVTQLSPRSTRGYLRTSLRCKQESLRLKNAAEKKSPAGKFQGHNLLNGAGEWRRMSLPAMLLNETVAEILQASQFAKKMTNLKTPTCNDPKTPDAAIRRRQTKKPHCEISTQLRARRTKEKQSLLQTARSELGTSPPQPLPRARSRITFKPNSPLAKRRDHNSKIINPRPVAVAHRVSPKNRPWAKKTAVLFPNPLFLSSSSSCSSPNRFYKTRSPIIATRRATAQQSPQQRTPPPPHKFLIKSPPSSLKSQMKRSKKAVPTPIVFSPVEKKKRWASSKLTPRRCSFSPSKLASRLVSPLRSRISLQVSSRGLMSGLKQRPSFNATTSLKISSMKKI